MKEHSGDRLRENVVTPTTRIMTKLGLGRVITAEERRHAMAYMRRRIAEEPATLRWRQELLVLVHTRAKG